MVMKWTGHTWSLTMRIKILVGKDDNPTHVKDTLFKTLEWLANLQQAVGPEIFLDAMPNNFAGRRAITEILGAIEDDR